MNNESIGSYSAEEIKERTLEEIDNYLLVVMGLSSEPLTTLTITSTQLIPSEYAACFRDEMSSRIRAGAPNYLSAITEYMSERLGDLVEVVSLGTFQLSQGSGVELCDALIEETEESPSKYPQIFQYLTSRIKSRSNEAEILEADQKPVIENESK